jgi:hypothetical protein
MCGSWSKVIATVGGKNNYSVPGLPDGIPILKPKIPIWANFGGSCNGRCWYILWPFGIFLSNSVYFVAFWYI